MNRNVGIATAIGIAIVIGVIGFQINDTTYYVSTPEEYKKSMGTGSVAQNVLERDVLAQSVSPCLAGDCAGLFEHMMARG